MGRINSELRTQERLEEDLNQRLMCRRCVAFGTGSVGSVGSLIGTFFSGIADNSGIVGFSVAAGGIIISCALGLLIQNCNRTAAHYFATLKRIKQLRSDKSEFNALRKDTLFLERAYYLFQDERDLEQSSLDFIDFLKIENNLIKVEHHLDEEAKRKTAAAVAV